MCFGPGVVDMGAPLVGRECVLVLGLLIWVHL